VLAVFTHNKKQRTVRVVTAYESKSISIRPSSRAFVRDRRSVRSHYAPQPSRSGGDEGAAAVR